jgi:hypothetical protein
MISHKTSKQVGREFRSLNWPSTEEVDKALSTNDEYNLLNWWRHLPSPDNVHGEDMFNERVQILKKIGHHLGFYSADE